MSATITEHRRPTPACLPERRTWTPREVKSRTVVGTITVVIEGDLVSLVIDTGRDSTTTVLNVDPGSSARVAALDAIIENAERILDGRDELVRVVISDIKLREELHSITHVLPSLLVEKGVPADLRPSFQQAIDRLGTQPMVVATDASRARRSRRAGIAAVTQDARFVTRVADTSDILHAELEAIALGAGHFRAVRPVVVVSDSQNAVRLVNEYMSTGTCPEVRNTRISRVLKRIHLIASERDVEVRWVRGHSGDPLNEAADRLAVLTRRSHGVDQAATQQVAERIVKDLVTDLAHRGRARYPGQATQEQEAAA